MRPARACRRPIERLRWGPGGLARLQRRFSVDHGGKELGLQELIDSLESLAFPAIAAAGAALVIQQPFQVVSQLVHDRDPIVGRVRPAINYIES